MSAIDFDHVTIDIAEHIKGYRIFFRNGTAARFDTRLNFNTKKSLTHVSFSGFAGFTNQFIKCYALTIPKIGNLKSFRILVSNNLFPNGTRPIFLEFITFVHLPHQFLISVSTLGTERFSWPPRMNNESYGLSVMISGITIETKRNKRDNTCNNHWQDYDNLVLMRHMEEAKCNIPYQKQIKELPMCYNQSLMQQALFHSRILILKNYEKPCKTMEDVRIEHLERPVKTTEGEPLGDFWIGTVFPSTKFKEIKQAR